MLRLLLIVGADALARACPWGVFRRLASWLRVLLRWRGLRLDGVVAGLPWWVAWVLLAVVGLLGLLLLLVELLAVLLLVSAGLLVALLAAGLLRLLVAPWAVSVEVPSLAGPARARWSSGFLLWRSPRCRYRWSQVAL